MSQLKLILILFYAINRALVIDAKINYVCKTNVTNIVNNEPIEKLSEHCKELKKPCAPKCCGKNEVLIRKNITGEIWFYCTDLSTLVVGTPDYKKIVIYNSSVDNGVSQTEKHFFRDFNLVRNRMLENNSCVFSLNARDKYYRPHLLENGVLGMLDVTSARSGWVMKDPEHFCVDLAYGEGKTKARVMFFVAKEPVKNVERERQFVGIVSVISSTFLALVLLVYCVLPQLWNLSGMLLMAYVSSLLLTFMIKAILIFFSSYIKCAIITAVFYFIMLSTFFWLNIMSFDIWWTFRGQRLKRAINRRGELVKFGWYSLYGWGVPLAMTIMAVIIDNKSDELPVSIIRPNFDQCFNQEKSVQLYMHLPTGILTIVNIVLFMMTIYNIWLIKRKLSEFNSSSNSTEKNQNRFGLYVKMSMMMGTSWLLELMSVLYEDIPFWVYVLINLYNALIGITIFVMFILTRKTIKMLCKRFNFQFPCSSLQDFIEERKFNPNSSRSTTKSSANNGSYHKGKSTEDSDVEMYDIEVSTNPDPKNC